MHRTVHFGGRSRLWREILQNLFKILQNRGLPDGKRRGAAPYGRKLNKIRIKIIQKYFLWGVHRAVHSIGSVLRTEIIQKFRLKIIQKFIIKECTGRCTLEGGVAFGEKSYKISSKSNRIGACRTASGEGCASHRNYSKI